MLQKTSKIHKKKQKRDYDKKHLSKTGIMAENTVVLRNNKRNNRKGGKFSQKFSHIL